LDDVLLIKLERGEAKERGDCTLTFWKARHGLLATANREAIKSVVHFIVG
jgi:hypothetical protein